MKFSFLDQTPSLIIAIAVFVIMLLFYYAGMRLGLYRTKKNMIKKVEEIGSQEAALIGMLGLFLAFTFSAASGRFDRRNDVIVREANAIGTAILRADMYNDSIRNEFRKDFKNYVETRIGFFDAGADIEKTLAALDKTEKIYLLIWNRAAFLSQDRENFVRSGQMIPALNAMIDIVSERTAASKIKVPELILWILFYLCFVVSFIMGYSLRSKTDWVVIIGFSLVISLAIFLILDLDRPRRGVITAAKAQQQIVDLRKMFKE
jgi:hypothetical protein